MVDAIRVVAHGESPVRVCLRIASRCAAVFALLAGMYISLGGVSDQSARRTTNVTPINNASIADLFRAHAY